MLILSKKKLVAICKARRMTQVQVAKKAGMAAPHLTARLNGDVKTSLSWVGKLSDALECNPADLLDYTPEAIPAANTNN